MILPLSSVFEKYSQTGDLATLFLFDGVNDEVLTVRGLSWVGEEREENEE